MLCIRRKPGEVVVLTDEESGKEVRITVDVKGSSVRLAFDAPDSVHIIRGELETAATK